MWLVRSLSRCVRGGSQILKSIVDQKGGMAGFRLRMTVSPTLSFFSYAFLPKLGRSFSGFLESRGNSPRPFVRKIFLCMLLWCSFGCLFALVSYKTVVAVGWAFSSSANNMFMLRVQI